MNTEELIKHVGKDVAIKYDIGKAEQLGVFPYGIGHRPGWFIGTLYEEDKEITRKYGHQFFVKLFGMCGDEEDVHLNDGDHIDVLGEGEYIVHPDR
jgi:hypothetical protein